MSNFLTSWVTIASQEELCFSELVSRWYLLLCHSGSLYDMNTFCPSLLSACLNIVLIIVLPFCARFYLFMYWSLTLWEEYILQVPENEVWGRILDLRRSNRRKLHSTELSDVYFLPYIIRVCEVGETSNLYGGNENCIQNFSQETLREEITWEI
jgi:hypothetical protein